MDASTDGCAFWARCAKSLTATGVFDAQGNPLVNAPPPTAPTYFTSGTFISQALDSELYRCQWHRVLLRGALPTGASVTVETYTAEARLSDDQIQGLSANAWDAGPTANAFAKGAWDCLVRSGAGRFLWLKLTLQSNGRVTPQLDSVELEFPRISLRRYLPAVFGAEATSADFTDRFLSLFDTTLRGFERELDTLARYFDPASAPAQRETPASLDFLSWLSSWIGVSLDRHWSETRRRRFVKEAGKLFGLRGTRAGLHQQLLLLLEMEPEQRCCPDDEPRTTCTPAPANCALPVKHPCAWTPPPLILEHYQVRRWLWVGQGRLGEQAALWGRAIVNRSQLDANAQTEVTQLVTKQDPLRDPFHLYAHKFSVFVPARVERSETSRKALENLLRTERPAQTQAQIVYVAPQFRIGVQSMLGYDTVIGRYPAGVTLGETPLGAGSVLTDATGATGVEAPSSLEIGKPLRIGTTTRL
ncbi:MAG: phage tail protein [Blastocatellia bacterium]